MQKTVTTDGSGEMNGINAVEVGRKSYSGEMNGIYAVEIGRKSYSGEMNGIYSVEVGKKSYSGEMNGINAVEMSRSSWMPVSCLDLLIYWNRGKNPSTSREIAPKEPNGQH